MQPLHSCHWRFDGICRERPGAHQLQLLLKELLTTIGMTPICTPVIAVYGPEWQAFQVIAESHIAFHGQDTVVYGEIFSCKPFDEALAFAVIHELLGGEQWVAEEIKRGVREPVA
jgi:S-adenosylmethionine/arginine decarboxylase-like enzyme